ncbi:UNVERIFIED_CONTAM: hypothetical protein Scaly_0598500 [Sesamum calycinum]|uniref:Uncharacterized protein n=1 Tax=Sesamum calycinum TaxID=2727403 RepID=A0AAW2RSE6_9LAMI
MDREYHLLSESNNDFAVMNEDSLINRPTSRSRRTPCRSSSRSTHAPVSRTRRGSSSRSTHRPVSRSRRGSSSRPRNRGRGHELTISGTNHFTEALPDALITGPGLHFNSGSKHLTEALPNAPVTFGPELPANNGFNQYTQSVTAAPRVQHRNNEEYDGEDRYQEPHTYSTSGDALHHDSGANLHIRILNSRENRQYIRPTANEIAALIVGSDTNAVACRDINVCKNDGYLKRISETNPSYTPFEYPLLFSYGTDGRRIGLEDAVVAGDTDASAVGRRIVFPSSFTGADQDKPITPKDIDEFICAEIPNKYVDHLAYETVVRSMVHGPCGPHNPNAPCLVDGKCSKHYPKKSSNQTTVDEDGFVSYRRRNNPNDHLYDVVNRNGVPDIMLTKWFEANK